MTDDEFRQHVKSTTGGSFNLITVEILDENGADPVFEGAQATGGTVYQYSMLDGVENIDGRWHTKYILGPVFATKKDEAAYKASRDAEQAERVRTERNQRLLDCDWTQLADAPINKEAWATYRQDLRNLPKEPGFPWTMTWPTSPCV